MGVPGLWQIVAPTARPTPLPTLNRTRLAVDASIWIYQFLKAVRDKEGNALRNSHIVGFFRRICKLLFFGIKPVFVFDGGAPALKRQTVRKRKERREGRREDAVRTAGKLLAVQMQRRGEEENERRKREREVRGAVDVRNEVADGQGEEVLPSAENMVYADEIGMSAQERQATRKFKKSDAYHLPDLNVSLEEMGRPDDPRIMGAEELEEYARQFNSGEEINLYDFSKIDFDGEFFQSLPAVDRYNILNAARLRSRLRMGLSKEQLEKMFPNRMDFSRFQIERVTERNMLTQRLMNLNGMNDGLLGASTGGRIAGDRQREYVLVKNDGVEGGYALGVVSTDREQGERHKPIDIDAMHQARDRNTADASEEEDEFEDVPVEGLNRLPRPDQSKLNKIASDFTEQRQKLYASRRSNNAPVARAPLEDPEPSFVDEDPDSIFMPKAKDPAQSAGAVDDEQVYDNDDEDLARAIAMSLETQHGVQPESEDEDLNFEDVSMPQYEQRVVEQPKPLTSSSWKMIAHIVNNRANAAVPKRVEKDDSSDSDDELKAALAASRKLQAEKKRSQPAPFAPNIKNPWDGPLPFERLELKGSIFGKRTAKSTENKGKGKEKETEGGPAQIGDTEEDLKGGFTKENEEEASRPLPPWLLGGRDIRDDVEQQRAFDQEVNAEDRERAREEEFVFQKNHGVIDIESSDDGSDVEVLEQPPSKKFKKTIDLTEETTEPSSNTRESSKEPEVQTAGSLAEDTRADPPVSEIPQNPQPTQPITTPEEKDEGAPESEEEFVEWSDSDHGDLEKSRQADPKHPAGGVVQPAPSAPKSPSPVFEDVDMPEASKGAEAETPGIEVNSVDRAKSPSPVFEDVDMPDAAAQFPASLPPPAPKDNLPTAQAADGGIFSDADFDDFSDPEDEELFAQLANEVEEHARFASELNNKPEQQNAVDYERELKALRNQQKKDRRDADEVTQIMVTEVQALLSLFGLPYITAPMEAEAQCAELVKLGLVDGIVTDDSDIFLFGGTRVYKNMFNSNKFVECYLLADLEKELSLSRESLISVAHLLGSDYTEGLPGVGPVAAMEILSEFPDPEKGLEEFAEWWQDVQSRGRPKDADKANPFRRKFRKSQGTKLFFPPDFPNKQVTEAYLKPEVDASPEAFQWGVPDLDKLRQFLMSTIGWTQERTDEVLVPVIRDMNRRATEGTQSNITRYFTGGVGVGARAVDETFARETGMKGSKRMREAVGKLKAKKSVGLAGQSNFGEHAKQWAEKNELSVEKQEEAAKRKKGKGKRATKGKGKGKAVAIADDADDDNDNAANGNDGEEGTAADADHDGDGSEEEYREPAPTKGKGKAKRKRGKATA